FACGVPECNMGIFKGKEYSVVKSLRAPKGRGNLIFLFVLSLLLLSIFITNSNAETKIIPVTNLSLYGGQYSLKGENTSFNGNLELFFTPVINFSPEKALMPMISLTYRGTKDVQELVGGGTMVREYADIGPVTLKYVHKYSDTFKAKIRGSYKIEYLKETKDETWQKGLFDYNKGLGGIELEKAYPDTFWNLRVGVDYYVMKYSNYASLISKSQTTLDTTTYQELSTNAGVNVLDYNTAETFIELSHSFNDNLTGRLLYDFSLKDFLDQKIANTDGSFKSELRKDIIHLLAFTLQGNTERAVLSLSDSIQLYTSNQNSYDAGSTKYIPNFYGYFQNSLTPSVTFKLGQEQPYSLFSLYWDIAFRQYADRLAQNSDATYTQEKINQLTSTQGLSILIPSPGIMRGLSFRLSANNRSSQSNMKYEKYYLYNYSVVSYFAGVALEY
ncbi:MAG: hypothetical protein AB1633_08220, partial [Elusimicrobiota bacterium]